MSDTVNQYRGIKAYLGSLVDDYGLQLVIKDFVGFLDNDKDLWEALEDYIIHKTGYCMCVKENYYLWKYCLYTKDILYKWLVQNPKAFVGQCYAGVVEYVIPILHKQQIIGAITIACDRLDKESMQDILDKFNKYYQADTEYLYSLYTHSYDHERISEESLLKRVSILAEYLGHVYNPNKNIKLTSKTPETYIMSHALAYLKEHFKNDITLEILSKYCHCSPSYLSHHFKRYTGITLKTYINQLRVQVAKTLLIESSTPVTQIAYELGYKDSNYFSKVFKDIVGISPVYYRANHKNI